VATPRKHRVRRHDVHPLPRDDTKRVVYRPRHGNTGTGQAQRGPQDVDRCFVFFVNEDMSAGADHADNMSIGHADASATTRLATTIRCSSCPRTDKLRPPARSARAASSVAAAAALRDRATASRAFLYGMQMVRGCAPDRLGHRGMREPPAVVGRHVRARARRESGEREDQHDTARGTRRRASQERRRSHASLSCSARPQLPTTSARSRPPRWSSGRTAACSHRASSSTTARGRRAARCWS
jgi:hypothetical protein